MTGRHIIVDTHGSLYRPLCQGLEDCGLSIRKIDDPDFDIETAARRREILGAYTWFYEGMRHPLRTWRTRYWLRRHGIPLFAWNQDAPHYLNRANWRLNLLDRACLFDIYATHTLIDHRLFAETQLYLPNADDNARYHLYDRTLNRMRDPAGYTYDVSFFGAMDGARYKEMQSRQKFFAAISERLTAHGIRFLFREAAGMSVSDQVGLIQTSRINLNFGASCDYGSPIASGLPERCYGIPACGGFLLCDRRTHARDDFNPGENWAEFDGLDDCMAKIDYWLTHFDEARDLAERCHAHVMAHHTYAHRAATLHQALLDWHAGKRGRLA